MPSFLRRASGRVALACLVFVLATLAPAPPALARTVDATSLDGKVLVGYQQWFRCPGDSPTNTSWSHYTINNQEPAANTVLIENYPDTSEYPAEDRCPTPALTVGSKPGAFFSSFKLSTTMVQFHWMQQYDIDGALLQRFICCVADNRRDNDQPERNAMASAEAFGRVFAIEYDLTGNYDAYTDDYVMSVLTDDWQHLVDDVKLTASSSYQRQGTRPVVSLWGLGFWDTGHLERPALALKMINWFHDHGVFVIGGVPWYWTNAPATGDADWTAVYAALDAIQPWTVGPYSTLDDVAGWKAYRLDPDMARVKANGHGQLYMPVILPGASGYNGAFNNGDKNAVGNGARREGGQFLWQQAANARSAGASVVKIAMFNEVNEGTAIFKVAPTRSEAPDQGYWVTLDIDGYKVPSDWYLRLGYEIGRMFRGETLPGAMPVNPGPPTCGALRADETLAVEGTLSSCNGKYGLHLQGDGNLVLYSPTAALWASQSFSGTPDHLVLDATGDLHVVLGNGSASWSTHTAGSAPAQLTVGDDGNMVLVRAGQTIWQSGTAQP